MAGLRSINDDAYVLPENSLGGRNGDSGCSSMHVLSDCLGRREISKFSAGSEVIRRREDVVGDERQRFRAQVDAACNGAVAGNDADAKTGVDTDCGSGLGFLLIGLRGGVGGVDIQIGASSNMCSDMCEPGGVVSLSRVAFWAGIERSL